MTSACRHHPTWGRTLTHRYRVKRAIDVRRRNVDMTHRETAFWTVTDKVKCETGVDDVKRSSGKSLGKLEVKIFYFYFYVHTRRSRTSDQTVRIGVITGCKPRVMWTNPPIVDGYLGRRVSLKNSYAMMWGLKVLLIASPNRNLLRDYIVS